MLNAPRVAVGACGEEEPSDAKMQVDTVLRSSAVVASGAATWLLHNHVFRFLGPVGASSFVGLLGGVLLPLPAATAAFCGSFAGMASTAVLPSLPLAALASLVTALLYEGVGSHAALVGRGGQLGLLAQLACSPTIYQ